mgnify:CR=1 FL=1
MRALLWRASVRHLLRHPWQQVLAARAAGIPVVVSMGAVAASGGYYQSGTWSYGSQHQPSLPVVTVYNPQDWGRKFLATNGGCIYIDSNHLEICLPEVRRALEHVAAWHAMLRIARAALEFTRDTLRADGIEVDYTKPKHAWTSIERDLVEMPKNIKKNLDIRPVRWIDEVLEIALADQPKPRSPKSKDETKATESKEENADDAKDGLRHH